MNMGLTLISAGVLLTLGMTIFVVIEAQKENYPLKKRGLVMVSCLIMLLILIGLYLV